MLFLMNLTILPQQESVDNDLGLETYMGRLKIEVEDNKNKKERIPRKKDHHWHYPLLNKCRVNQAKTFLKIGSLSSTIHKIKL